MAQDSPDDSGKLRAVPDRFTGRFVASMDQRTALGQGMRSRYLALTGDLGGVDQLSYAQRSLCERALWLEHWLSSQERLLAAGDDEAFDPGKWTQACNALQGILNRLGLERRVKDVPSLRDHFRGQHG